jgi:hypothetical protein
MKLFQGPQEAPAHTEHGEWSTPTGRPRVLIENPDGADLWAHASVLREAGYDIAVCGGPSPAGEPRHGFAVPRPSTYWENPPVKERHGRSTCPLVSDGHCPLVEGADVVVSTVALAESDEILQALSVRRWPPLVVEGTPDELERDAYVIGDATRLELPVTPNRLLAAVEQALGANAAGPV